MLPDKREKTCWLTRECSSLSRDLSPIGLPSSLRQGSWFTLSVTRPHGRVPALFRALGFDCSPDGDFPSFQPCTLIKWQESFRPYCIHSFLQCVLSLCCAARSRRVFDFFAVCAFRPRVGMKQIDSGKFQ